MTWFRKRGLKRAVAEYQRKKDLADLFRSVLVDHDRKRDADAFRQQLTKD